MMNIEIYQIDVASDYEGAKFMSLSNLEKLELEVDPEIYKLKYSGEVDCTSLEEVFATFNNGPVDGFTGHSLSVSDVIGVKNDDNTTYYFCDTVGFEEVSFDAAQAIENKITVVMCEPDKLACVTQIDNDLDGLQGAVGGLIEGYYPFPEQVCIVCNDEGKINGMPLNRSIVREGKMIEIMAGPFFICDCSRPQYRSLTEEQQKRYLQMFKYPELFFRSGDEIHAVPYNPDRAVER